MEWMNGMNEWNKWMNGMNGMNEWNSKCLITSTSVLVICQFPFASCQFIRCLWTVHASNGSQRSFFFKKNFALLYTRVHAYMIVDFLLTFSSVLCRPLWFLWFRIFLPFFPPFLCLYKTLWSGSYHTLMKLIKLKHVSVSKIFVLISSEWMNEWMDECINEWMNLWTLREGRKNGI